jgi:hypothetical protein
MFMVSLQILGFLGCVGMACEDYKFRSFKVYVLLNYVLDIYSFPANFRVLGCVFIVMCWMFIVSLQILGF